MTAYILFSIIILILVLLVFSENRNTQAPKTDTIPEEHKLREIKKKGAEERLKEETERAKAESKKRLEASRKAAEEQKEAEARAHRKEERKKLEEEKKAREEAEEAKRKAAEEEARQAEIRREEAALKAEKEQRAKEEARKLAAEKAEKEAAEAEAAKQDEAEKEAEKKAAEEEAQRKEKVDVALPDYPAFDHSRLLEMGLSDEEATDFVKELIVQVEEQLPLIEAAMQESDLSRMERLTHSIKGSATNIGTGGISDLITAYNTYLKTDGDIGMVKAYYEELVCQVDKLKAQYL